MRFRFQVCSIPSPAHFSSFEGVLTAFSFEMTLMVLALKDLFTVEAHRGPFIPIGYVSKLT